MATGDLRERIKFLRSEDAFLWAFGIGSILICLVKFVAQGRPVLGGLIAASLGIITMGFYMYNQKQTRTLSELPRLGDEIYYIGLLYTLTSLCAALVILFLIKTTGLTLEERTDEMIGSFGIALLTTMAGIVMRMTLQHHDAEEEMVIRIPSNTEGVTLDLERFAYELRRQLRNSTNAFASHTNISITQAKNLHAHMEEMMRMFHDGLERKAKSDLENLNAVYKAVGERTQESEQQASAQRESISNALAKLESQVSSMDESIDRIRIRSDEAAKNLGAVSSHANASAEAFAASEKIVTEGLNALAEGTSSEASYRTAQERFIKEMGETLTRQMEEWSTVQQRASEAVTEMKKANESLASMGQEATNLSSEFANLPDKVHGATIALEKLTEAENASQSISILMENTNKVAEQLSEITGAIMRHEEAVNSTIEITNQEIEGRLTLNNSITEFAGNMTKAVRISEHLKVTEGEFQQIIVGLNNVSNTLQMEGQKLSDVLNHINSVDVIPVGSQGKNSRRGWKNLWK